jgi:glyoxylase I family protein
MSTPQYLGIHHASVLVGDTRRALAFYHELLGMPLDDTRPDLGFPGAWLGIGAQQIHLIECPSPDPVERPPHGGRDRHTALAVADLEAIVERLEVAGWPYTRSRSGRAALFCRDPDGNTLELVGEET